MIVCVDASLALKWLTCEPGCNEALAWLGAHAEDELIAPAFFPVEVASVLSQKARRKEITVGECFEALRLLDKLKVRLIWDWALLERAFELAVALDQPTAYDTAYLALAEREQCEFWTADVSFARVASVCYPLVRSLM